MVECSLKFACKASVLIGVAVFLGAFGLSSIRDSYGLTWTSTASYVAEFAESISKHPDRIITYALACFGAVRSPLVYQPGQEYIPFDEGYIQILRGNTLEGHGHMKEALQLYNDTEALGMTHSISELLILEFLVYTSWTLAKYTEGMPILQGGFAKYNSTMTEERRASWERWLQFFFQQYNAEFFKENAANLDTLPVEEQVTLAKQLASTLQYDYCRDEHAGPRNAELSANPRLHCRVDNRGRHPFLIYSPVKEEIVNLDPVAVIIHDLIRAKDTELLISQAESKLSTAGVNGENGTDFKLHVRRARTAWVASMAVKRLTRHLEAVTGLNPYDDDGCEMYQVGHYPIGGHYIPHFDYFENQKLPDHLGNRIATLMFYLNDPEEGGQTVFHSLKFRVSPVKGAAIFWYDMFRNESMDVRTYHGGCPVIRGEKWVANKWFRFRGQLLHKPCGLTPEVNFTPRDFVMPEWMKWANPSSYSIRATV